jgi:subfamily B ATP-binding cassette protein MsbA
LIANRIVAAFGAGLFRLGSARRPTELRAIERRCARFVPAAVALGLVTSAFEGVGIGMLMPLLSELSGPVGGSGLPGYATQLQQAAAHILPAYPILPLLLLVLVLVLLKATSQTANATLISYVEQSAGHDIRCALANRVLTLDYSFFLRQNTARLVTIVDTDSWKVTEAVRQVLTNYSARTAIILFAILLVLTEWRLALVVTAGLGLSRVAHRILQVRLRRLGHAVVRTNQVLGEQMIHAVRAIRIIRVFGQEQREATTFTGMSHAVREAMFASDRMAARSAPTIEIILVASILAVLFASTLLSIDVPQAATFLVLLYRAQIPVMAASQASLRLASLNGAIGEVEWLLGTGATEAAVGTGAAAPLTDLASRPIRFDRVRFHYPASHGHGALNGIDMIIPPRTVVALIGASGSGKSTIINLLCRLVEPSEGAIWAGDRILSDIDPARWRNLISLAGQDTDLVMGTVAQNIAYGVPDSDMAAIEAAATLADADEFIRHLPQGYATTLDAIGFGLSGGQRQRLGIARAILRRPEILVFDEATSAVDGESEARILERLTRHRPFGRAIVVSHAPKTLIHCEFGIVLSAGTVIEAGQLTQLQWYRDTFPDGNRRSMAS